MKATLSATVRKHAAYAALTDSPVLLVGEAGAGTEIAALAIHDGSDRRHAPFKKIRCSGLPIALLEGELFGYERGVVPGLRGKPGKLEKVHGGTLFLDEIDELHASLQAKLLGVLQHGEFLKMGGVQPRRVDVRILAATTRDLSGAVHGGKFARDLHQRLTTIQIRIPPLRERRKEIPRLVRYFIARYARMLNLPAPTITSSVMRRFVRHRWRGNLPELEIAAARVVLLGDVGAAVHAFPAYSRRRRTSGEG